MTKRALYLTHRWVGVVLGLLMLAWFVSGVALMYYSWPAPTAAEQLAMRRPLGDSARVVGFAQALRAAESFVREHTNDVSIDPKDLVGGRLQVWAGRPMYEILQQHGGRREGAMLVDATTGSVHFPVTASDARRVTEEALPGLGMSVRVDSLGVGDRYLMAVEYAREFPAWRVGFADAALTAAYVSRRTGIIFGIVDRQTRVTTWIGAVPHWLYFRWLHDHPTAWTWSNYLLPAVACLIALTGIVLGVLQLFPRRHRGEWRMSGYHGVSLWHHVSGIVFGVLVLTWTFTGVLEMLGPGLTPARALMDRAQLPGDPSSIVITPTAAVASAQRVTGDHSAARTVEFAWAGGRGTWTVQLATASALVDATTAEVRTALPDTSARTAAARALGTGAPIVSVARLDAYDDYYFAGHGRGLPLPVVRVRFDDAARTALYLHPLTGLPLGFVDASSRRWRWWRDALHTFDIPALNNRRPLWDIVTLIPMLGGIVVSLTGVWLLLRRLRRKAAVIVLLCLCVGDAGAQFPADWTESYPPFRIAENLYYVGSKGLANYLITTPQGHILINSDLEANVPMIRASIEQLGFKFSDVKILLISHAHWDHDAGSAMIKQLTGARYMVMDADVPVVESGGANDFHYANAPATHYPPATVDRVLHDGDEVRLGDAVLVAHLTPGHTKGCTTWTMQVRESGRTYDVVIVGSPNVNPGYVLVGNATYPRIAEDFDQTFRVLNALPVEIFLGAHGSYFDMDAKYARFKGGVPTAFIDPDGYRKYVAEREQAFRTELARQRAVRP